MKVGEQAMNMMRAFNIQEGFTRAALQMRRLGFTEEDITRVFYDNPKRIFNLGLASELKC